MATPSPRRLINRTLLVGTVLIVFVVGAYTTGLVGAEPVYVRTTVAERRTLTHTVEAFGRVQPRRWVAVRPQLSGQVVALPVEEGIPVERGALLARLRTDRHESRLAKARARLKQKKARVARRRADSAQARRRYERQATLFEAGVSFVARRQEARHAVMEASARLDAARAQVAQARAELERIEERGKHLEIRAPASGVVSQLRVDVGEHVVGTGLVPGTPMMRIDQMDRMEFRVSVGESNVPAIAVGDSATVQIEAHPGEPYPARVLDVAGSRRPRTSSRRAGPLPVAPSPPLFTLEAGYPVRLTLRCPGHEVDSSPTAQAMTASDCPALRTGMSGTARIRAATIDSAVTVPRSAVTFRRCPEAAAPEDRADGNVPSSCPVVFAVRNGVARQQPVETGLRTKVRVEIRSGLRPGDEVAVGPADAVQRRLSDGNVVEAHSRSTGASSAE